MGVEIERKFTVKELPKGLESYPYHEIEQAYLNVNPAIRVRREDDTYYMTYKCKTFSLGKGGDRLPSGDEGRDIVGAEGNIGQTEYNMPLDKASYEHLRAKADGNIITKKRYLIPLNEDAFERDSLPAGITGMATDSMKIELDVFLGVFEGRILAEVEFPSEEAAKAYKPASWFDEDVTGDIRFSNSHMSSEVF